MVSMIVEAKELVAQFVVAQAKDITPQTKRVLHRLQKYLARGICCIG